MLVQASHRIPPGVGEGRPPAKPRGVAPPARPRRRGARPGKTPFYLFSGGPAGRGRRGARPPRNHSNIFPKGILRFEMRIGGRQVAENPRLAPVLRAGMSDGRRPQRVCAKGEKGFPSDFQAGANSAGEKRNRFAAPARARARWCQARPGPSRPGSPRTARDDAGGGPPCYKHHTRRPSTASRRPAGGRPRPSFFKYSNLTAPIGRFKKALKRKYKGNQGERALEEGPGVREEIFSR